MAILRPDGDKTMIRRIPQDSIKMCR
jgi:hypothetical protein